MIEKIIKSAKCLLLAAALSAGCAGRYEQFNETKRLYAPSQAQACNNEPQKPDVIQRASFYVFYDTSKEPTAENLTWNFEYRLAF